MCQNLVHLILLYSKLGQEFVAKHNQLVSSAKAESL